MTSHWQPFAPSQSMPWNFDRAKHLHRRAAFGATWAELQRDLEDGPEESISRLLAGTARSDGQRDDFESISQIIGDAAVQSGDQDRLKAWWLFRLLFTPDPLREKLTLMWHCHFATSNLKVDNLQLMRGQNALLREHGSAKFGSLLHAMLHDPAMLIWLDANSNRSGHPNENLARELMELFTLGVGNYSEEDVKEAARALTGWSTNGAEVIFKVDRHDEGEKTTLGQTAKFDAEELAKLLLHQAPTSRRLAWRLCGVFMGEGVAGQEAIEELAQGLYEHDLDIAWAVETILRSELFFTDENIGSRVSSPVEFVVGTVRSLELFDKPPSTLILAEWCTRLGQDLFYPPNVGGWAGGRSWLTSRSIIGRSNFASALVAGELRAPVDLPMLSELVQKYSEANSHETMSSVELFETLLLSVPSPDIKFDTTDDLGKMIAHLLSCPQAHLN